MSLCFIRRFLFELLYKSNVRYKVPEKKMRLKSCKDQLPQTLMKMCRMEAVCFALGILIGKPSLLCSPIELSIGGRFIDSQTLATLLASCSCGRTRLAGRPAPIHMTPAALANQITPLAFLLPTATPAANSIHTRMRAAFNAVASSDGAPSSRQLLSSAYSPPSPPPPSTFPGFLRC